ncbi:MAG: menaquinone biosynthesis protein [Pirellulaceae bacterium]
MAKRLRIGAVSYLNTRPLVYGLQDRSDAEVIFDLPSRLADRLSRGELDVALIPSVEYFLRPDYRIVSDACIGCRGPVLSVKLFCRRPVSEIKTLALDEGSRTSATLTRILLAERHDVHPQLRSLSIGEGLSDADADAVLLIGDRAIGADEAGFAEVWDLGDVWCRWSELPFVFAMWVAREDVDASRIDTALAAARDAGVTHMEEIAEKASRDLDLAAAACLSYLRDNLYFFLGPRERRGLELFYEKAVRLGAVPRGRQLRFHDCETTR